MPYSVGVSGEGNALTLAKVSSGSEEGYIATVASARGIGQASVAWWGNFSPHPLRFHLQLMGLELFSLSWATPDRRITVNVSVNSSDQAVIQSVILGQSGESEITALSPYWLEVTLPSPERSGYLLTTPAAFAAEGPRLWAIAWVDFYR
jgi:hypothetical protein